MRFIAALCLVVPAVVHALPQHNIVEANTTVHSVVGNSAPLHVHFCTDIVDCDSWAAARPGGVSVQMPQGCREAPVPGSVQAIAVVFTNASTQTAHRSAKRAEGDLLLACAENAEGQGEIAQFRRVPSLPIIAADELNSTDCVLLALTGSAGERHTKLKGLYQELKMCGYDALAPPGKIGPMKPVGRLNKLPEKDEIIQMITEENYMRELRKLSGADPIELPGGEEFTIRTRNTYSDTNLIAAEHMARFFQQCGLQDVQLQDFVCCGGTGARNVIARQPGVGEGADEVIVVGAHFDSLPSGDDAPSAVDNGSGTIGVLTLAAVFSQFDFNRTIEYVAFGAEEQGLHGSAHYVAVAQERGEEIVAALTMDMIGYSNRFYGVTIEGTTSPPILELMDNAESNTREYGGELTVARSTNSFGSDHVSFQRAGIPAILFIEQDDTNYDCYHRDCDSVDRVNPGQSADIVRGCAGSLVDLASGQAPYGTNQTVVV